MGHTALTSLGSKSRLVSHASHTKASARLAIVHRLQCQGTATGTQVAANAGGGTLFVEQSVLHFRIFLQSWLFFGLKFLAAAVL